MSFTLEVKSEISSNELHACCAKAQLAALMQFNGSLDLISGHWILVFKTTNPTTAKRILVLAKKFYDIKTQISYIQEFRLKKNKTYVVKILNHALDILKDIDLYSDKGMKSYPNLHNKDCCKRAYLAGCFLAAGSVNSPKTSNYHLEIACSDILMANFVLKLMNSYYLDGKIIKRRNQEVVYLKSSEKIGDFLRCVGAHNSLMAYEDIRIQRDFMNNLSRLDNCEIANEVKTINAANSQIADIELLLKYRELKTIDKKLAEIINIRLDNRNASLKELCDIYEAIYRVSISKSGMAHRLAKIKELASAYVK
ncbi:MAG: DNA-binding protein WhiA [Erysipelotrichaceae bacterium]